MTSMHRPHFLRVATTLLILVQFAAPSGRSQPQSPITPGKIDVKILHAIHEPEETAISYVTVSVTVRSAGTSFVVPTCSEDVEKPGFCMASLRRSNGRVVPVRKGLEATLGYENESLWKPVQLSASGVPIEFQFSIDMGLLAIRPGEAVRIAFWIWPNTESMKDLKMSNMVLTPVFRIPTKPE